MTFPEFQATGRDVTDLSTLPADLSYECPKGTAGRVYVSGLVIEDTRSWVGTDPTRGASGRWYVLIGNREFHSDSLSCVEWYLYRFAVSEGIA
jgi:hypothetical protein